MSYLNVALIVCFATLALVWMRVIRVEPGNAGPGNAEPPKIGGIALSLSILAVGLLATRLPIGTAHHPAAITPILTGGALIFLIGLLDDLRPLPPAVKLAGQVMAAGVTYALGLSTGFIAPGPGNALFTIFCLVGGANALNLIDGLDGLAGGVAFIAAVAMFAIARDTGRVDASVLAAAIAGGSIAFLWFNLPPARAYLGDSGSNFLGFTLGALPLLLSGGPTGFEDFSAGMLLLAVPIVETATSIGRRLVRGKSPMQRDRGHMHHRLLRGGWSIGAILALGWGLTLLMGGVVWMIRAPWAAPIDRAATAWSALGVLLLTSVIYVGRHAPRLSGSPKR